jgi:hypothetical protein
MYIGRFGHQSPRLAERARPSLVLLENLAAPPGYVFTGIFRPDLCEPDGSYHRAGALGNIPPEPFDPSEFEEALRIAEEEGSIVLIKERLSGP